MRRLSVCACACVLSCGVASAYPTALFGMPIADILGHREAAFCYGVTGNERRIDKRYYHAAGFQVGLFDRGEVGVDSDFEGTTTWNVKLLLHEAEDGSFGVSAGVMNGHGSDLDKYVAGRIDFSGFRFHAALIRTDRDRFSFGIDYPLPSGWSGFVEHGVGREGATWAGINASFRSMPQLVLTGAVGVPNERGGGVQHSFSVTYGVRF